MVWPRDWGSRTPRAACPQSTSGPEQHLCPDQRGRESSPTTAAEPQPRGRAPLQGCTGRARRRAAPAGAVGAAVRCLSEGSRRVQNRSDSAEADFQRQKGNSACAQEKGS